MLAAVGLFVRHGLVIRVGFRRRVQHGPGVLDELVSAIWRTKSRARWLAGSQELAKILGKKVGVRRAQAVLLAPLDSRIC